MLIPTSCVTDHFTNLPFHTPDKYLQLYNTLYTMLRIQITPEPNEENKMLECPFEYYRQVKSSSPECHFTDFAAVVSG